MTCKEAKSIGFAGICLFRVLFFGFGFFFLRSSRVLHKIFKNVISNLLGNMVKMWDK